MTTSWQALAGEGNSPVKLVLWLAVIESSRYIRDPSSEVVQGALLFERRAKGRCPPMPSNSQLSRIDSCDKAWDVVYL